MTYRTYRTTPTPQSEALNARQSKNNAGGFSFTVDSWKQLDRFLVLGSEGGTYYVGEPTLTRENARNVEACIVADGKRAVDQIVAISDAGRAPKNDPAIFALAMAASAVDAETRAYALANLGRVCRIPTHLFHFVEYIKGQRGWGRGLRSAISNWYGSMTPDKLAFELVKYQSRDGWSNRDVLRKTHTQATGAANAVLRWAVTGSTDMSARDSGKGRTYPAITAELPRIIMAFEEAKTANRKRLIELIITDGLTREMVPTEALTDPDVWQALLIKMPIHALVRNLATMTKVGLIAPMSAATKVVVGKLERVAGTRLHPLNVLNAERTYASGHGFRGSSSWTPVQAVVDALDEAFYASFGNVTPTGKDLMLALDISGSMEGARISGTNLTAREASAALALVTANVEKSYGIFGFDTHFIPLAISPRMRLDAVLKYMSRLSFGGTDCALPMIFAKQNKIGVDAFAIYTDSETWAGRIHPPVALREYRASSGRPHSKLIVNGMTATRFTIADPQDPGMLDVAGFDTATPEVMSGFITGAF
jgi:60 kDa SS-A/Ro ribonucleoprotein